MSEHQPVSPDSSKPAFPSRRRSGFRLILWLFAGNIFLSCVAIYFSVQASQRAYDAYAYSGSSDARRAAYKAELAVKGIDELSREIDNKCGVKPSHYYYSPPPPSLSR